MEYKGEGMKRLFVSDLDGTLLNRNARFSDRTIEVVNRGIQSGLHFTISTARTPSTAIPILEPLNLQLPIMLMNGVLVYDMKSKTYINKAVMEKNIVMVLLGLIKVKGLSCFLYGLTNQEFCAYYDSVESTSLTYFRNEQIMKYDKRFTEVEDLSLVAHKDIVYCMLREKKESLEGLYRELSVVKGVRAEFYPDVYNDEYYFLEIYSEQASKRAAVEFLKEKGRYDSVVAFGDNLNDKGLLEASNYFYAVANAHPQIRNMAHGVLPSNEEDGVACYLEQMMLEEG